MNSSKPGCQEKPCVDEDAMWDLYHDARRAFINQHDDLTARAYETDLRQWEHFLDHEGVVPWEAEPCHAQAWIDALEQGRGFDYAGPVIVNRRTRRIHHPECHSLPKRKYAQKHPTLAAARREDAEVRICTRCARKLGEPDPLTPSSIHRKLIALRSFYNFLMEGEHGN